MDVSRYCMYVCTCIHTYIHTYMMCLSCFQYWLKRGRILLVQAGHQPGRKGISDNRSDLIKSGT